jgi:hypothetical protein
MSKLNIFRDKALLRLQESIVKNEKYYRNDKVWIDDYFGEHAWDMPSKLDNLPDDLLIEPTNKNSYDFENSQRIYKALHGLSRVQASDPRMWTYLTHVKYWKYMRLRWPITDAIKNPPGTIRDRYFLMGDKARGLTRNGISRLWWGAHACVNAESNSDDDAAYKLLKPLFAKQDVYASFMERAFSKNTNVMKPILTVLSEQFESGRPFDERIKVRSLAKHLVLVGGVTVVDAIDSDRLKAMVSDYISNLG